MTDPSRYQTTDDSRGGPRRDLPRSVWIAGIVVVLVTLAVVVVVLAGGGHDPSQFKH